MTSGGNNFNHFAENQLTKFNARDVGDFNDAVGEREMAPKCGRLLRDVGDLVDLHTPTCTYAEFADVTLQVIYRAVRSTL